MLRCDNLDLLMRVDIFAQQVLRRKLQIKNKKVTIRN